MSEQVNIEQVREVVGSATPTEWWVDEIVPYVWAKNPYGRGQMMVCEMRGWGHLTGQGGGCAMDDVEAVKIQDANAQLIANAPKWLLQMAVELEALRAIVSDVDMELISETPLSDTHWEQIKLRIDEYATGGNDDDTR